MKLCIGIAIGLPLGVGLMLSLPHGPPQIVFAGTPSVSGDVNGDGRLDLADGIFIINFLFRYGPAPAAIECGGCDSCCPSCPTFELPATGQTTCFDSSGNVIDCAGSQWPGQDGHYQAGCSSAGRFVDNGDGTVTDDCTGLVWQKDGADVNGDGLIDASDVLSWQQALQHCENLEFAGRNDWRLPNVRELQSIVDYGRSTPSIDPVFGVASPPMSAASSSWYWSSSSVLGSPGSGWHVSFDYGYVLGGVAVVDKSLLYYVRAVRDAR